jgi:PAS domain S-box-containing protein
LVFLGSLLTHGAHLALHPSLAAWLLQAMGSGERLTLMSKVLALTAVVLALTLAAVLLVRHIFRKLRSGEAEQPPAPRASQEGFAFAAFQGVIQRLREQEKELERLHRAERLRAEQNQQLSATVMNNMVTGLITLNAQGLITDSNPAARDVLGHELLVGRRYDEVLWPAAHRSKPVPQVVDNIGACLSGGHTFRRNTFSYRAPSGQMRVLGVGVSPIRADGHVTGAICLLTDLTEITALQEQVRIKENLAALGQMAAGIAHEFKNSLATISGYAQLIREEESLPKAREFAHKVVAETQLLTKVVTDFLNFSRPMNLVACDVPLREIIESAFAEITAHGEFSGVELELAGEFPTISADRTLLRQCCANLLRNACQAIAEAGRPGRIRVQAQLDRLDNGPVVKLSFSDDGDGISPDNLEKLFIPFFTTKNTGTGLGLALVHKIVVNHNGQIWVTSEPGKGATFTFALPLAGQKQAMTNYG